MAYGLDFKSALGQSIYSVTSQTWSQVEYFTKAEGDTSTTTKNYSYLPSGVTLRVAILFTDTLLPDDEQPLIPTINISGTTVTVTGTDTSTTNSVSGTITQKSQACLILVLAK